MSEKPEQVRDAEPGEILESAGMRGPELADQEPEAAASPDSLETLKAKAAKADEHWDLYLRARADLDNYRKRVAREREEAARFANLGLIEKLLPALDNLEMALAAAASPAQTSGESLRTGIGLVQQQLKTILSEAGLQEIEATGQRFDPQWHEAVAQQDSTTTPEDHVLQQLRKGYKLHDRLVRPASVVVARKPSS